MANSPKFLAIDVNFKHFWSFLPSCALHYSLLSLVSYHRVWTVCGTTGSRGDCAVHLEAVGVWTGLPADLAVPNLPPDADIISPDQELRICPGVGKVEAPDRAGQPGEPLEAAVGGLVVALARDLVDLQAPGTTRVGGGPGCVEVKGQGYLVGGQQASVEIYVLTGCKLTADGGNGPTGGGGGREGVYLAGAGHGDRGAVIVLAK